MTPFVALLRAINVGGTGKLPMRELALLCEAAGFRHVRTYIASGNVVFGCEADEDAVRARLEARLHAHLGKPCRVHVRTVPEMAQVLADNPFPDARPDRTIAIFLDAAPPADALEGISGRADEAVALGRREIYVHYGEGMGTSKLKIPAARLGTARNINTVAKLAAMARAVGS